jgi:hypothetical protein
MTRCFLGHAGGGELAEFILDQRQEFAGSVRVARLCPIQNNGHSAHNSMTAQDYYNDEEISTV